MTTQIKILNALREIEERQVRLEEKIGRLSQLRIPNGEFCDTKRSSQILGISVGAVYQRVRRGQLCCSQTQKGGKMIFDINQLNDMI